MKRSDELKKEINAKRIEVENYQSADQLESALKAADDLNRLMDEYKVASALEAATIEKFKQESTPIRMTEQEEVSRLRNRAFNKLVLRRGSLTDAERRAYFNEDTGTTVSSTAMIEGIPAKGGYLVPPEQLTTLREYRKEYPQLRNYCRVIHANALSGVWPTLGEENRALRKINELETLQERDFEFGQAEYKIYKYGDLYKVSNELIEDANVSILSIIGQRIARSAVNAENAEILELLSEMTPTPITTYKQLIKSMVVDLDPVYYANARIYTNQDGFLWMSTLEDENKRPLMTPDVTAADTYRFRGKEIVVVPNATLQTKGGKAPIYVGNMSDHVMFFERAGLEIAMSTEYLFANDATVLRAVTRFGVVKDDVDAMKAYQVTVS